MYVCSNERMSSDIYTEDGNGRERGECVKRRGVYGIKRKKKKNRKTRKKKKDLRKSEDVGPCIERRHTRRRRVCIKYM